MERLKQIFSRSFELPKSKEINKTIQSFSSTERVLFWLLLTVFSISAFGLLIKVNNNFLVTIPDHGGLLSEGAVGSPRFLNPLLAIGDADKDLTALIYSGLMRATPQGNLITDLAESYSVSDDGLIYDFILKDGAKFHDGTPVTTDDIEFTIMKAQDSGIKSPKRGSWDGVLMEKVNSKEIKFILKQPYTPFLENTTIGILPKHIWKNANADEFAFSAYNTNPIGTGPYKVTGVKRNSAGIPTEYTLKAFNKFALGEPFVNEIILKFYQNENDLLDAYDRGEIESMNGISGKAASILEKNGIRPIKAVLPRVFGVFFNQNQATIFANKEVREALDVSLDKDAIVRDVLFGYGVAIDSPLPPTGLSDNQDKISAEEKLNKGREILQKAGWKFSTSTSVWEKKTKKETLKLSFSISTSDTPELKLAAQKIQENWQKLGASVDLLIFETGDLNQNIIRPRKYDALFFGEIVGRDRDLYPFWHSSQRNDPGLNIAMYVNNKADKLLESTRTMLDGKTREEKYIELAQEIKNDTPAVFVYSPFYLYVVPKKLQGVELGQINISAERFLTINSWYIETNKIWKIFSKN